MTESSSDQRSALAERIVGLLTTAAKMRSPCLVVNRRDVERLEEWKATFAEIGISVKVSPLVPERQMFLMDEGAFRD